MASTRKTLTAVAVGGCLFGLAAGIFYFHIFAGEHGEDWMVYYSAIRTYFDGKLGLLYDGAGLTADLNARFASWLAHPLPLHPWLYPPHYLLLLLPFGLLSPGVSATVFLFATFVLMAAALCLLTAKAGERLLYVLSALLSPAAAIVVWLGQNTFLTAALLVGGFALSNRRPLLAGVLLGVLTYKPQFWLMVPVALIAARQWKTLASAFAAAGLVALASLAVFGVGPWEDWFHLMTAPSALFNQWQAIARINGQSLYTYAVLLGAGTPFANTVQFGGAALAALAVWRCFSRPCPDDLRIAVLLAATVFAAPHIIDYDAVLLCIAATVFISYSLRHGAPPGDTTLAAALWLTPLINPPSVFFLGMATPLLVVLFVLRVMERGLPQHTLPNHAFSPA